MSGVGLTEPPKERSAGFAGAGAGTDLGERYEEHHRERRAEGDFVFVPERIPFFQAAIGRGRRVLDLGCRSGAFTRHFLDGNEVVGLDVDRVALAKAAELGIETVVANVEEPLPSRTRASTPWSPASSSSTCDSRMLSSGRRGGFFVPAAFSWAPCRTHIVFKAGSDSCADVHLRTTRRTSTCTRPATCEAPRGLRRCADRVRRRPLPAVCTRACSRATSFSVVRGAEHRSEPEGSRYEVSGRPNAARLATSASSTMCPSRST